MSTRLFTNKILILKSDHISRLWYNNQNVLTPNQMHNILTFFGLPQQAEVAQGVPGRLRPRIFLTFRHYKGGRSSAKRTGRLYPRRNPWYSLSEAESTSGHMVLSGVPREKIHSDTTGNRSRDLPTSSAMPNILITIVYIQTINSNMFWSLRDHHQGIYTSSNCA